MRVPAATALARRIFGADIDRALRPLLAVALIGSIAGGMVWSFLGIWAIHELGARETQLGTAFLVSAIGAAAGGYLGGHLSDHFGRRPLILFGWIAATFGFSSFALVGHNVLLGLGLLAGGGLLGSLGHGADQALVADLVPPERQEAGYASIRVANNLGVTIGPPIGGALLLTDNWNLLFLVGGALCATTFFVALRYIPRRGAYAPESPPDRGSARVLGRDRLFLLFFASGCLATLVYVAYETVLPISLVDSHGLSPSTWGFLVVVNPAMVTFFQLRLTQRVTKVPASMKLGAAMLLMGLPFLLLTMTSALLVVGFVIFVFVIGEMLWVPTSQAVIARIAPADLRGAYLGAFGGTFAVGFALTPFFGLQMRAIAGDDAMWVMFAALSVAAAALGFVACTAAFGVRGTAGAELEEAAAESPAAPAASTVG